MSNNVNSQYKVNHLNTESSPRTNQFEESTDSINSTDHEIAKKFSTYRYNKHCLLTTAIVISLLTPTTISKAETVDDFRELSLQQRLSEKYTEADISEIESNYKSIEANNELSKYFNLDEIKEQNKQIKKQKKDAKSLVEETNTAFTQSLESDALPSEVLERKEELSKAITAYNDVEKPHSELQVKYKKNTYKELYEDVLATLAELESYKDIGIIGEDLYSPVINRFQIKRPFGYQRTSEANKTTINNKGLNLKAKKGTLIQNMWKGKVTDIYTTKQEGTVVEVTHHKNLKTYYKQLAKKSIKVKKNQTVNQYTLLGKTNKKNYLHLEVILDQKAINPIYFFGTTGANALRDYVDASRDPLVREMRTLPPKIKDGTKEYLKKKGKQAKEQKELQNSGRYKIERTPENTVKSDTKSKDEVKAYLKDGFTAPAPTTSGEPAVKANKEEDSNTNTDNKDGD